MKEQPSEEAIKYSQRKVEEYERSLSVEDRASLEAFKCDMKLKDKIKSYDPSFNLRESCQFCELFLSLVEPGEQDPVELRKQNLHLLQFHGLQL